jgi:putative peptide zinc metalloprotease protein
VLGVGVGWYWFGPVAFVDTSDLWLATRRQQILASLAGPYADLLFGGVLSLAALAGGDTLPAAICWQLALGSYLSVVLNLNPLLEYDGYYVLMDALRRPNLRQHSTRRLGDLLRGRSTFAGSRLEVLFGLATVLYVAAMCVATVVFYRLLLEDFLAGPLPPGLAAAVGWALAGINVVLAGFVVASDLRGSVSSR